MPRTSDDVIEEARKDEEFMLQAGVTHAAILALGPDKAIDLLISAHKKALASLQRMTQLMATISPVEATYLTLVGQLLRSAPSMKTEDCPVICRALLMTIESAKLADGDILLLLQSAVNEIEKRANNER